MMRGDRFYLCLHQNTAANPVLAPAPVQVDRRAKSKGTEFAHSCIRNGESNNRESCAVVGSGCPETGVTNDPFQEGIMAELQVMLNDEERQYLTDLLERTLKETRVEEHRTRSPRYRENVIREEMLMVELLKKIQPPLS
jgi:hypothetical protein